MTFEEVFQIAQEQNVDFVLLGGDLFHDNKPSRMTLVKAMDVLARYCLNDRPVSFEILSDETENFVNGSVANLKRAPSSARIQFLNVNAQLPAPELFDWLKLVNIK